MCGIAGQLRFEPGRAVEASVLEAMAAALRHRGPDGSGMRCAGRAGLAHTRLAIIDPATGAQPIGNEDGSVWLVCNGEIYNFRGLRADLERRGHRFATGSDCEVIVHLYEDLGADCVARLHGMFAFALWDERRQRLLLARDRLGIKPLYLRRGRHGLAFASEIKALLADPEAPAPAWAPDVLERFLALHYVAGEQTLLAGIEKLAPGHSLRVEADGRERLRRYWDLSFEPMPSPPPYADAVAELDERLQRSVREHLMSDVPLGVLLSGGVDSSGVLHYAGRAADAPLHSFTVGFAAAGCADERPFARLAAAASGSLHHETSLSAEAFADFLPRYIWHMEEPVCEPPAVALYVVSELARRCGIKVLLSGEGGDEAFGGYPEYRHLLALERIASGLGPARALLGPGLQALAACGLRRAAHYAAFASRPFEACYWGRTYSPAAPSALRRRSLYRAGLAERVSATTCEEVMAPLAARTRRWPLLHRMLYMDCKTWLPDDLLLKADRMTMAASVELRVPLLDHTLLEFVAALPAHYKLQGRQGKRLLRSALGPHLPAAILERPKAGFPVPYAAWLRGPLAGFVAETLLASDGFVLECCERRAVATALEDLRRGRGDAKTVFCLLVLELWHRQFVRGRGPVGRAAPAARPDPAPARAPQPGALPA